MAASTAALVLDAALREASTFSASGGTSGSSSRNERDHLWLPFESTLRRGSRNPEPPDEDPFTRGSFVDAVGLVAPLRPIIRMPALDGILSSRVQPSSPHVMPALCRPVHLGVEYQRERGVLAVLLEPFLDAEEDEATVSPPRPSNVEELGRPNERASLSFLSSVGDQLADVGSAIGDSSGFAVDPRRSR